MATDAVQTPATLNLKPLRRTMNFDRAGLNDTERTCELALSSEEPYERWFGVEILGHKKDEVDLERLNDGAPLLVNHDIDQHIGVIEPGTAKLAGGVLRARARFGTSPLAEQIFQDVKSGIRSKTSIAYIPKEMKLEKEKDGVPTYRVTKWLPLEGSIVSIPADNSVGVGRSSVPDQEFPVPVIGMEKTATADFKEVRKMDTTAVNQPSAEAIRAEAAARAVEETNRVQAITALARQHNQADKAAKWIADGVSVERAQAEVLDSLKKSAASVNPGEKIVDLTEKEERQYSMLAAARQLANLEKRGFEGEVSDAIAKKLGKNTNGMFVPTNIRLHNGAAELKSASAREQAALLRTLSSATTNAPIATDLRAQDFIEMLRNLMAVKALGAKVITDLSGNVDFPKQTGAATLSWTGENPGAAVTASDQAFSKVSLSPKTAMAATKYTRQFMLQSSLDVEQLLREDLATIVALGVDLAAINGSGASNQPTGILVASGTGVVAIGTNGGAPTYEHMVDLETKLAEANIPFQNIGLLTTPGIKGKLRKTQKFASTNGDPVWENNDVVLGYKAVASNQVPSTLTKGTSTDCHGVILGAWSNLIIGQWEAFELIVDPYTDAGKGNIIITVQALLDIALRHAAAFSVIKDARIV